MQSSLSNSIVDINSHPAIHLSGLCSKVLRSFIFFRQSIKMLALLFVRFDWLRFHVDSYRAPFREPSALVSEIAVLMFYLSFAAVVDHDISTSRNVHLLLTLRHPQIRILIPDSRTRGRFSWSVIFCTRAGTLA